jgi:hypothetical protein
MPRMIQPHGVPLDESADAGSLVVAGGATGTVVDWVSVVTMIAGRVVVDPGVVVVTAVVVVVVIAVVVVSVVVGSATVRVLAGSD